MQQSLGVLQYGTILVPHQHVARYIKLLSSSLVCDDDDDELPTKQQTRT